MTMASSTTKPVAMVRAISDKLFSEKPARYMAPKVPISDSGTVTEGIRVALNRRRKTKVTITTSPTASSISCWTSVTAARMVSVRSLSTAMSRPAGRLSLRLGSSAWMRSTVWMTLAPG